MDAGSGRRFWTPVPDAGSGRRFWTPVPDAGFGRRFWADATGIRSVYPVPWCHADLVISERVPRADEGDVPQAPSALGLFRPDTGPNSPHCGRTALALRRAAHASLPRPRGTERLPSGRAQRSPKAPGPSHSGLRGTVR
ncbi:hypothetical protein GCM10027073_32470 [Streptomyces chlorus]